MKIVSSTRESGWDLNVSRLQKFPTELTHHPSAPNPLRTHPHHQHPHLTHPALSPPALLAIARKLLSRHFGEAHPSFTEGCLKWLQGEWGNMKGQVRGRLSKLAYLQPSLQFQGYAAIEVEVLTEWRRNPLLRGLHLLWEHRFLQKESASLQELQGYYLSFLHLAAQLTFVLFQAALRRLTNGDFPLSTKLRFQTAVQLVTSSLRWPAMLALVRSKLAPQKDEQQQQNEQAGREQRILQLGSELRFCGNGRTFVKTGRAMEKLAGAESVGEFVAGLKEFRGSLVGEIQAGCEEGGVVEKDEVLGCIMFAMVKHGVDVGVGLRVLGFVLGEKADTVLSWHRVDSFKADLEVAQQYLSLGSP